MSAVASRAVLVSGASVGERPFLKRPRGGSGVTPAFCGLMTQEKLARRIVATDPSAPPAPKRACRGIDVKVREDLAVGKESVAPASGLERLKQRMEVEHDALGSLFKKAVLLSRGVVPAGKDDARIVAAKIQLEAPSAEAAAKTRKSTTSKPASEAPSAEAAAKTRKSTTSKPASEVTKQSMEPKKQQPAFQSAAPRTTKGSVASNVDKAKGVKKRLRLEEIARAREKFRLELLEVEKAAMPDETIYPEELEELGIAAFQYVVTRTRKRALLGSG